MIFTMFKNKLLPQIMSSLVKLRVAIHHMGLQYTA